MPGARPAIVRGAGRVARGGRFVISTRCRDGDCANAVVAIITIASIALTTHVGAHGFLQSGSNLTGNSPDCS